jgi:hypothetical protein
LQEALWAAEERNKARSRRQEESKEEMRTIRDVVINHKYSKLIIPNIEKQILKPQPMLFECRSGKKQHFIWFGRYVCTTVLKPIKRTGDSSSKF